MNAAARLIHQGVLVRPFILIRLFGRRLTPVALMSFAVLFSALAIIYVTQTTRLLNADYQHELNELDATHLQHGQLLLERSLWQMEARTQHIAEQKLHMVLPDRQHIVMVSE